VSMCDAVICENIDPGMFLSPAPPDSEFWACPRAKYSCGKKKIARRPGLSSAVGFDFLWDAAGAHAHDSSCSYIYIANIASLNPE